MRYFVAVAAMATLMSAGTVVAQTGGEWTSYGHDGGQTKYSPLDQINTKNVSKLQEAWTYHMAPKAADGKAAVIHQSNATPLVANGLMYIATPYETLVALKPETGEVVWTNKVGARLLARSLTYWPGDGTAAPALFIGGGDGKLYSVNALNGETNKAFGENGALNLKTGVVEAPYKDGRYTMTSAASIYKNLIITGADVQEAPDKGPAGDVRGWDTRTGKLVWTFHSIPRKGELGYESWGEGSEEGRSGTNVWGFSSVDAEHGLVFLPFGSPSSDFFGGDRIGNGLFGNTLVVLHADTGKVAWHFQAVHHDIDDYDLESAPVMITVKRHGKQVPAVALTSKTGLLFILDRMTGKPIYDVVERPVQQSTVEGERTSPTQPFPVKPAPLGRTSFAPADLSNVTPEHHAACEKLLAMEGGVAYGNALFTPYGPKMTIVFPGTVGVVNWHGMSYDPKLGYLFVNTNELAGFGEVVPTKTGLPKLDRTSPWGMYAGFEDHAKHWPCQAPPWGQLIAINVNTGDVAWKQPFGTIPELDAAGVHNTGSLNYGGTIATGGGLVFVAASTDRHMHAYEAKTGKLLWDVQLDVGAYVTPSTYMGKDGRQYVVVVDTGGGFLEQKHDVSDKVIAYALPKK